MALAYIDHFADVFSLIFAQSPDQWCYRAIMGDSGENASDEKDVLNSQLIAKLASVPPEQQFTSSITFGELISGAHRLGPRSTVLLGQIKTKLIPNLPILPFDAVAARRYGEVRALLEGRGTSLGDADLRIAAIALVRSLTVVTANTRHFRRVPGLPVENWLL